MAKRENESASIKDLMDIFINGSKLKKGFQKMNIEEAWAKLMGAGVSSLIVSLSSSVLREELSHGKAKIIKMLNDELGETLVKKLMLV